MPAVAAAASWIESFKLPLREVYGKYTKSELAMLAWRSSEMAANMHHDYQSPAVNGATPALEGAKLPSYQPFDREMEVLEDALGPVAAKLTEDLDMRKLTGPEALHFMRTIGVPAIGMGHLAKPRNRVMVMGVDPVEAHKADALRWRKQ